jgi:hypothetical protein
VPKTKSSSNAVDDALEAVYATFARYGGTHLEGCPHCVAFEESAALRRIPLRRLGAELERYLFKAMTTWGTEDDFKYFLPRLLELHASSSDAWLLCDKLAYARWRSWSGPERAAVENYLSTLWRAEVAAGGPPLPGNYLLGTLIALDIDLAPYDLRVKLDAWRADPSRDAARQLAQFVSEHRDALFWASGSSDRKTLWQAKPDIAEDVRVWLLEAATRERLEASFMAYGDPDIARAFDWLDALARQR